MDGRWELEIRGAVGVGGNAGEVVPAEREML